MKILNFKKTLVAACILATMTFVALVFSFCTSKTGTSDDDAHITEKESRGLAPCDFNRIKSPVITVRPGLCVVLEVVCCRISYFYPPGTPLPLIDTCIIDGWIYLVECNPTNYKILDTATFHFTKPDCNGCPWVNKSNIPIAWGLTTDEIFGLLSDMWLADCPCFQGNGGGNGPCDTIRPFVKLPSGKCITYEILCCDGELNGWFEEVDCGTGKPIRRDIFCAKYKGQPHNPNAPDSWTWCGSSNAPSDILSIVGSAYLIPCI